MKNIKKIVALGISMVMASSLFTGCSTDGIALFNAMNKTEKVATSEVKCDMTFHLSGENLSEKEQKAMAQVLPILDNSKLVMDAKVKKNEEGTSMQFQGNMNVQAGGMAIDMPLWMDYGIAEGKPYFKEIIKMPQIVAAQANGKQYMVMDSTKSDKSKKVNFDYSKLQDMQKQFMEIINKNVASFDPGFEFVTDKGNTYMELPGGGKNVHVYELKLDDKTFKQLMRYSADNMIHNPENIDFFKNYMTTVLKASNLKEQELADAQKELDKSVDEFQTNLPEYTSKIHQFFDSIADLTIIGDRGIVIDYAVNEEGYIVNTKGNMDFVLDVAKIAELAKEKENGTEQDKATGIYKLGIDFNADYFNLNQDLNITFPEVNSENSTEF